MSTPGPDMFSFIMEEFNKLEVINEYVNSLKQEAIDYINTTYGTNYTFDDFYLTSAVDNSADSVYTDGYYSNGYTSSCYYNLFSVNPAITVTANIYVNSFNSFVMEVTPNGLVPVVA